MIPVILDKERGEAKRRKEEGENERGGKRISVLSRALRRTASVCRGALASG